MAARNQSLIPLEKVGVKVALGNGTAACVPVWGSEAGVGTHMLWNVPLNSQTLLSQQMTSSMSPDG